VTKIEPVAPPPVDRVTVAERAQDPGPLFGGRGHKLFACTTDRGYTFGCMSLLGNVARWSSERRRDMARKKLVKGLWSKDDIKQLRKLFPNRATADVASNLGRPTEAVKKKASRMGLRKSRKYMKSLGRT